MFGIGCLLSPLISLVTLPFRMIIGWLVGSFIKAVFSIALFPIRLFFSIVRRSR